MRFLRNIARAAVGGLGAATRVGRRAVRGGLPGAIAGAMMGIPGGPAGMAAGAMRGGIGGAISGGLGVRNPILNAVAGAAGQHFLNAGAGGQSPIFRPGDVIGQNGNLAPGVSFLQNAATSAGNNAGNNFLGGLLNNVGGLGGLAAGAALGAGASGLMNRGINEKASGIGVTGRNPAINAMPYLNQIPAIGNAAYNPFINQGRQAENVVNPLYNQMAQNPTGITNEMLQSNVPTNITNEMMRSQNPRNFLNEMMQSYTPSEGYRFKEREMLRAAQNSAAQGGFSGTRNDQMSQSDLVRGLLGEDMQQYLANLASTRQEYTGNINALRNQQLANTNMLRQMGLAGQEGRIGRGFEGAGSLADYLGSNLGQQANLVFTGEGGENTLAHQASMQNALNRMSRRNANMGFLSNLGGLFGMGR